MRPRRRTFAVAALLVLVAACSSGHDVEPSAKLACTKFREAMTDLGDHVLTVDELRGRLQDVDHDAQASSEPGVASSARAMLQAVTAVDDPALADATTAMGDACMKAGA